MIDKIESDTLREELQIKGPSQGDILKGLLPALGSGALVLLSVYFRGTEEPILSDHFERELTRRIYNNSEQGEGDFIRALLGSACYVNKEMITDLLFIKHIAEELLEDAGTDPLLAHVDTQLYKLERYIDPEEEDLEETGPGG